MSDKGRHSPLKTKSFLRFHTCQRKEGKKHDEGGGAGTKSSRGFDVHGNPVVQRGPEEILMFHLWNDRLPKKSAQEDSHAEYEESSRYNNRNSNKTGQMIGHAAPSQH
ncbi:hypothetical protein V6N11_055743 [Hibiscus sabdariffa]|uniref:Uncharacterized protein n=1 Tax=Hibiscus sabdariffa TaxID=183260 RepID=A0ABR2ABQ4_9ROSI